MPDTVPRPSVLIVEDDPDYNDLLREAFTDAGFRALRASNGQKALNILHQEPVDLVVSDFVMPEVNGLELCRLLQQDFRLARTKVILYSGNPDGTFRRRARELGAVDYLAKSGDPEQLVRQICELTGVEPQPATLDTARLKVLLDDLLGFVQILAAQHQPTEAGRVAAESAQRVGTEIRRLCYPDAPAGAFTASQ